MITVLESDIFTNELVLDHVNTISRSGKRVKKNRKRVIVKTGLIDKIDIRDKKSLTQDSYLYNTLSLFYPERCYY
jgi:hypothetical protein